jgi:hypothetical protein
MKRLIPEFRDDVEPAGLESRVTIGNVTGHDQERSTHESEMVWFCSISWGVKESFCTQNTVVE